MTEREAEEHFSKTQRKRQMLALQDLGEELVELNEARLNELGLPERLHNAVQEARRINKFGARRRQLQFIGKLMRDVDADAIAAKLEAWKGHSREQSAHLHRLERWRQRLLADDEGLSDLAEAYPGCDLQRIRTAVRNARHEQEKGGTPVSSRQLFQLLKEVIPPPAGGNTEEYGAQQ